MPNREYKIGNLVILYESELIEEDNYWHRYDPNKPKTLFFIKERFLHGIVREISKFHIPEGSDYVVECEFSELGPNHRMGVGNKSEHLRKTNSAEIKDLNKFPSEFVIMPFNSEHLKGSLVYKLIT